jgi:Lon protease-like protein
MIPILPFPFNDILLPGQTKQLNLYEERFHLLFEEALENHSVIGMGLLAGTSGMMTLLPLLEVESFTRLGYDPDWVSSGDGMGNGSILVTVRAVGRAKIVEELEQEHPFMRARVTEVVDDGGMNGVGMVKEKSASVKGEVSEVEVGSMIAGTIETLILSLASMGKLCI